MSDFWVGRYVKENWTQYIDRQDIVYKTQVGRQVGISKNRKKIGYPLKYAPFATQVTRRHTYRHCYCENGWSLKATTRILAKKEQGANKCHQASVMCCVKNPLYTCLTHLFDASDAAITYLCVPMLYLVLYWMYCVLCSNSGRVGLPNTFLLPSSDEPEPSWLKPELEQKNFQLSSARLVTFSLSSEIKNVGSKISKILVIV